MYCQFADLFASLVGMFRNENASKTKMWFIIYRPKIFLLGCYACIDPIIWRFYFILILVLYNSFIQCFKQVHLLLILYHLNWYVNRIHGTPQADLLCFRPYDLPYWYHSWPVPLHFSKIYAKDTVICWIYSSWSCMQLKM